MKNKSSRHKEDNTFKFLPFSERIANIDVDIFHKVEHEYETEEEDVSYFFQTIQKWGGLNLTEGYQKFCREVHANNYITLPQLLLSKEHVVEVLLKHLRLKNALSLQPLLEIVVAVAKDLRKEFYEYYPQFLQILIELLGTKDTEQLEWTFTCLAYLFKFLWRSLIKNISNVFHALLPLLSDSRPEYVQKFAAESFAFVARKVKDKKAFLALLLHSVKSKQDGVVGCGTLLFAVLHGVEGQFHSSAEAILPFLIDSLSDDSLPQPILFEILEQVVANIVATIHPAKSNLLWTTFLASIAKLSDSKSPASDTIDLILKLVGQSIEYKSGRLLQNPVELVQSLVKLLTAADLSESLKLTVCKICIVLLLSKNVKLPQEQASIIIRNVINLPHKSVYLYFVEHVSEYASFEAQILPSFLKHCVRNDFNCESYRILTKLILKKSPLCFSGINIAGWTKYPVDFGAYSNINNKFKLLLNPDNIDDYFCGVVCLPHFNLKNNQDLIEILAANLIAFVERLAEGKPEGRLLFLLNITIECLIHLAGTQVLCENFSAIMEVLLKFPTNLLSLKSLSLVLVSLKDDNGIITMDNLRTLNRTLETNFSSPHHEVRLLSSHIYTNFESLPEFNLKHSDDPEILPEEFKVFSICYRVESIESHVHTYRDQLQALEKLNFEKPQMLMCNQTEFKAIPLRYLCGALYINFQLLWEPITKIIASLAAGLEINVFWSVYGNELRNNISLSESEVEIDVIATECDFLGNLYQDVQKLTIQPNFVNYRLLLWKAMNLFPDVAEARTRDTSDLFLSYINNEYNKSNSDVANVVNIKEHSAEEMEVDDEEIVPPEGEVKKVMGEKGRSGGNGKANLKTLLHMLGVFSKVRSPLSMYREPDLYKLYFDLLQHRNYEIQKAALDCILSYKHKHLTPYKDHLYNLVDDKNFKNEITSFRIDTESANIQPEHREQFIPLVMQIVFSKMSTKTGLRTGGKSSGQNRRNLILRFLAGCQEKEMLSFIEKAFRFYKPYLDVEHETLVHAVDLEKFIPPKKLQSTINFLNVVIEQFGGLMGTELLTFLLKIVMVIGASIKGAFLQSANIHAGYLPIIRSLRTSCIKIVDRFFEQFDRYSWTASQINMVFDLFVWPYLSKLNVEGIHSPTTLLKLIAQWGSNPRYFSLLVKHQIDQPDEYILPYVIQLLTNEKSNFSVINAIQEMIERLLNLKPDDEDVLNVIPVDHVLPVCDDILQRAGLNDKLNYGSCILLPHVPLILSRIKRKLQTKSKSLNQKELFILSRASELVWEPEISDQILQLLLPVVLKKCSLSCSEDVATQFLTTVANLLQNVSEPQKHLRLIMPLFAEVQHASCRKLLMRVLEAVAAKFAELEATLELIRELNAYDAKWLDQPDFERRHDAFRKAAQIIEGGEFTLHLGVLLIYNCYYLVKSEKDLSLRENSSHTLKLVCPALIKKFQTNSKDLDYILNTTIFNLIRVGMKSKSDDLRYEVIGLLGHLARECPDSHFILRDLHKFTNKVDLEVDLFANLTHLQLHRHCRALLKFCQLSKELEVSLNARTLTQFILPLTSFYLLSEKYSSKNSIVDAAIETVGVICRMLPWHQYDGVLKFYLSRLRFKFEYQKQLVRLVVGILDAFHFDLEKGHGDKIVEEVVEGVEEDKDEEMEVDEFLGEVEEEVGEEEIGVKVCEKTVVLCKSTACRVIKTIQMVLLPQLHKSLAEMTAHEKSHKLNRKKTGFEREEEDLSRVPISLAVVKLLQRLPTKLLEANLPGVFMKLCTFLKSQLESVRRIARETLQKIMVTLGPQYLNLLLSEITPLMNRGFQMHVLVFAIHSILCALKEQYKEGDIDKVLSNILNLCTADLFGTLSEEKEVAKIAVKVSEAKSTKSFDTFEILAQYISAKCLIDLILPLKTVLESSHSFKTISKVQEALRHIAIGLVENNFISVDNLMVFAYGTASESIPQLSTYEKVVKLSEKEKLQKERPDCFIIAKIPGNRMAYRQKNLKSSKKANAHLLVEFGMRMCFIMLKKEKIKDEEYKQYLDPFVAIFKNCLNSKHIKLGTLTMQCLTWVLKYDLPSLGAHIKSIAKDMFAILHKYAAAGLNKGDNFDLVVAAFKAMAVLVREVKCYTVNVNQLKILLLYAEQDMYDHDRQATAFSLLKAIIARKLVVPEIHDVMKKVAELSVISELTYVRAQARSVFHQFVMDYPLGEELDKHLNFYLSQMNYELQFGRESAIEMIQTLVHSFPIKVLKHHSGTLLVTLAARLVNDEVPECRKKIADCISMMLKKFTKQERDPLYEIVTLWFTDKNISHRRLAAQLCGIFVMVEKSAFESRLKPLLPLLLKQFGLDKSPGKFVKLNKVKESKDTEEHERIKDHHLFQVLQLLLKLAAHCPSFVTHKEFIENVATHSQSLLAYPHDWVRLGAAQFLGFVLSACDTDRLAALLVENKSEEGYLYSDPETSVKSLSLDLCDQLQVSTIKPDLAEQVIKNLVFVARVLQKVPLEPTKINLLWLTKRMRKIVNTEVVEDATSNVLRMEVFKWIAGVGTALDLDQVLGELPHLLAPLVREMITTEEKNAPLRQLAKEVATLLKKRVGLDTYTSTLSKLQQNLSVRRAERKRHRTQLAVTDPEMFAKMKIKHHEKKRELKKRKMSDMKGVKRNFKKRRTVNFEEHSEIM